MPENKKWRLIIDVAKCEDCNNCFLACKDEHVDNDWPGYSAPQPRHGHRWMNIRRKERGRFPMVDAAYLPVPCMHCAEPPCAAKANGDAVYQREDGIVLIDPVKAKGRKDLVGSCPYGAIYWNQELDIPQKCTLCAHLLDDAWKEPRCVGACAAGALRIVRADDAEMNDVIAAEGLETLHPEYNASPRVYYKNLYRFNQCFIGGSVAVKIAGREECAQGVRVRLHSESLEMETATDCFGDFKFDGLAKGSGPYRLEITHPDHGEKTLTIELDDSLSLGTISLA